MDETKIDTTQLSEAEQPSNSSSVGSFVWELVKILAISLIIIVPFRVFVAEPFIVSGHSMVPNFQDREYLIVNKAVYLTGQPKRGDVIVLKYPKNTKEYFIKRIIGLPGDTIKIDQGRVIISNPENPDGKVLKEDYLSEDLLTIGPTESVTLKDSEYYVLGDNRNASLDSRVWGILPRNDVVGKAFIRVLPLSRFSVFTYNDVLK